MAAISADDIFSCIFVYDKFCILIEISQKFVPKGPINGLALNRWQAIIWTNADPIHWHIYAALGGDELTEEVNSRLAKLPIALEWAFS